ncbi:MAG: hypothetical protein ACK535_12205, partial [Cyanobacteriota bacterium]
MRSRSPRSLDSAPESRRRSGRSSTSEHSHPASSGSRQRARQAGASKAPAAGAPRPRAAVGAAHLGKQDLLCSLIGLGVKLGLVMVTGVSLVRVASAYQARMDRQGELAAVLQIENAQLTKAQQRFDRLFLISGEKTLAREQSQWIAPNRLRVVWQAPAAPTKAPAAPAKAPAAPSKATSAPSKAAENAPDPAPPRAPGPPATAPHQAPPHGPPTRAGGQAQHGEGG